MAGGETEGDGTARSELFDPRTNTWRYTTSMNEARTWAACALLKDGRFLVAGGGGLNATLASCETCNPLTETWTFAGTLTYEAWRHTLTAEK